MWFNITVFIVYNTLTNISAYPSKKQKPEYIQFIKLNMHNNKQILRIELTHFINQIWKCMRKFK